MPESPSPKEDLILEHIARYRLTTNPIATRLYYPEHADSETPSTPWTSMRRNLKRKGYIDSAKLFPTGKETYYYLTQEGALRLGYVRSYSGEVRNRRRFYARLLFCCAGRPRPKLTRHEFERAFPGRLTGQFEKAFHNAAYYIDIDDQTGTRRLGQILDITEHFQDITTDALANAERFFPDLVRDDRFALAIVTHARNLSAKVRDFHLSKGIAGEKSLRVVFEDYDELFRLTVLESEHAAETRQKKAT